MDEVFFGKEEEEVKCRINSLAYLERGITP